MIEPVMYFGIGFLVAALLGLLFVPLVHNRAVRLTMRRLEAATPLSIAEIRADKDQLRAEFAMSTRRLEMSVAQMKTKATTQLADLGKKSDAINQLKKELGEKTATIFALEARDKTLREQLRATEDEFGVKTNSLREAERMLSDKEAELVRLVAELGEHSIIADNQRVELAALRTQVEAMKVSVADYDRTVKDIELRLTREREDSAAATANLTEARTNLGNLGARTTDLERQLLIQTTEAEVLNRRVQELEGRLGEQGRVLAERDYHIAKLGSDIESARQTEADLRNELATTGGRNSVATDRHRSEISQLEAQLAAAIDDRNKLQRELATIKRDTESSWASERVENALLRERINDVAAEVARLTAALEGPGSTIMSMLEVDAPALGQGSAKAGSPAAVRATADVNGSQDTSDGSSIDSPRENKSTLADRIRALQSTASRAASTN
jgi:predicted  nucleic acid-binding Zn-ribbon protein